MIEMVVESVRASLTTQDRIVMLKERDADRYLPIRIGQTEAFNIAIELQKMPPPRPLTPDLLKSVIQELGAKVTQIVVTDLSSDTFYARIIMDAGGRHVEIDSRPSDAIALAVRAEVPILVSNEVLERAGVTPDSEMEESSEESGEPTIFKELVNSMELPDLGNPEDRPDIFKDEN